MTVHNEHGRLREVVMCEPVHFSLQAINVMAESFLTKQEHPQAQAITEENRRLRQAYQAAGIEVHLLEADPKVPYQVFTRDVGVMTSRGMLVGGLREDCRRAEVDTCLASLAMPLWQVSAPQGAYLEGGDLMYLDDRHMAVGVGARTNAAGAAWACEHLHEKGIDTFIVEFDPRYLHLDMIFNVVGDGFALAHVEALPQTFCRMVCEELGFDLLPMDDETVFSFGAHRMALDLHTVLSPANNTKVNKMLIKRGFPVVEVS